MLALALFLAASAVDLHFLTDGAPEFEEWRESWLEPVEGSCPFDLELGGAHAFDEDTLAIFGDVRGAPGAYRSYFLRSTDGGHSWHETMAPVPGSSVTDVSFVSRDDGFALVGWVVEGPGDLRLYRTADAGEHWTAVSEVPKPHSLDVPLTFSCATAHRCRVELECVHDQGSGHVVTSEDAGRTWQADTRRVAGVDRVFGVAESRATDGTRWSVRESADGSFFLIGKARPHETSEPVAVLPRGYSRGAAGDLVPCDR